MTFHYAEHHPYLVEFAVVTTIHSVGHILPYWESSLQPESGILALVLVIVTRMEIEILSARFEIDVMFR